MAVRLGASCAQKPRCHMIHLRLAVPPPANDGSQTPLNTYADTLHPAILMVAAALGRKIARDLIAEATANDKRPHPDEA